MKAYIIVQRGGGWKYPYWRIAWGRNGHAACALLLRNREDGLYGLDANCESDLRLFLCDVTETIRTYFPNVSEVDLILEDASHPGE